MKGQTLMSSVSLAILVLLFTAARADEPAPPSDDCSKWTLNQVRVGMTIEEVRRAFPSLKFLERDLPRKLWRVGKKGEVGSRAKAALEKVQKELGTSVGGMVKDLKKGIEGLGK